MIPHEFHAHGPVRSLDTGLAVVEGAWKRSPLGRRMTILQFPGGLLLHSSIRVRDEARASLEALGMPRIIAVPNAFHFSDAGAMGEIYPDARILVPEEALPRLRSRMARIDGTLEGDWPAECEGVIERVALRGTRFAEVVMLHVPSRTLVLTDLCFHLAATDLPPVARLLMRLNGAVDRFGPSRLARLAFISDPRALAASLAPVFAWDFDRVIVSHGRVLETGGKAAFREAMSFL